MMEAIRISITENSNGNLFANAGLTTLFRFRKENVIGPQWHFFPEGNYSPVIFYGDEFPWEYFENLCRATFFIYMHVDEYPGEVKVVQGRKLLPKSC